MMIIKMKSAYLLTFDLLFTNNYEMSSASEAAGDFPVCSFLFAGFSLCFVPSFLHLVQSQNDCYKVSSTDELVDLLLLVTAYWMVCFTIKKEK